ncbi:MAG: aldehyde ferredoxin oxidoreductase family protein [Thermodesulfobacteriota bacterium]
MASRYKGYTGRVADIDLSSGTISDYPVTDEDREKFLGGRYLSTKILWDTLKPGVDPLSSDNLLIVMTSPLTATGAPSSSRYDISAKSPLTGGIGHSNSGGNFGIHLKRAGFDGVIVRGKAAQPVYIEMNDGQIAIRPAGDIWGTDTQKAQEMMLAGNKGGTMAIGPAGENLVRFASVVSQERSHGRAGMGAVMGSKNLKGMAAFGKQKIDIAAPEAFKQTVRKWVQLLQSHPATGDIVPKYGTAVFVNILSRNNALPTRNFTEGTFEKADDISGERLAEKYLVKNFGCVTCPIRCGRVVEYNGKEIKGPEYEILCLMGANLGVSDMDSIIRWNYELDLLGMDTISIGNVLGFATELNRKGLWKNDLDFGRTDNISAIIADIAYRRGIGSDLAEGVKRLSEKYGGAEFAAHSKGLEMAAYEPRSAVGHGLGYATANRGACHLDGGYMIYFEVSGPATLKPLHARSKPGWVILDQNLLSAISAGGNCLFTSWTFVPAQAFKLPSHPVASAVVSFLLTWTWPLIDGMLRLPPWMQKIHLPMLPHSKAIKLATGMPMDFGRFVAVGNRGFTLERMFNLREGIDKKQDWLPRRFTHEPLSGDLKRVVPLDKMLPKYYQLRGWDSNGNPTDNTLKKLGLWFTRG